MPRVTGSAAAAGSAGGKPRPPANAAATHACPRACGMAAEKKPLLPRLPEPCVKWATSSDQLRAPACRRVTPG